jgi:hypothetical protein
LTGKKLNRERQPSENIWQVRTQIPRVYIITLTKTKNNNKKTKRKKKERTKKKRKQHQAIQPNPHFR